jgi:hypothetical protein
VAGYLAQRDAIGRIRAYAHMSTAGLEGPSLCPESFEALTPCEARALAIHRQLDRELHSNLH